MHGTCAENRRGWRFVACVLLLACWCQATRAQRWPVHTMPVLRQALLSPALPDTARLHALTDLAYLYVLRPGIVKSDIDTALQLARAAAVISLRHQLPTWEARIWLVLSDIYREQGDARPDSAMHATGHRYALKAYDYFTKAKLPADAGYALAELANYMPGDDLTGMQARAKMMEQAAGLVAGGKDWHRVAGLQERVAETYALMGDYQTSLVYAQQALDNYRAASVRDVQGVYNLMAADYGEMQDREQAIRYSSLAAQTSEALHDSSTLAMEIYNYQGIHYFRDQDWGHALQAFRKGWELARLQKDTNAVRFLLQNMGNSELQQGHIAAALDAFHTVEQRYPPRQDAGWVMLDSYLLAAGRRQAESPRYVQDIERRLQHMSLMEIQQSRAYLALAKYYLAAQRYAVAKRWIEADLLLERTTHNRSALMTAYEVQYQIDTARGDYVSAIHSYQQYSALKDSLFSDANAHQVKVLQARFETAKKDQELRLRGQRIHLLDQQALLQQAALRQAHFTRNLVIGGALMLLFLLLLGYSRYQLKKRSNAAMQHRQDEIDRQLTSLRTLTAQQEKLLGEKEWLMKELHHRVKNSLQVVISLLNTQSAFLQDDHALMAIRESQHRMQAMSLIHQRLYQGGQVSCIEMNAYFRELVAYLEDSLNIAGNPQFHVQGGDLMLEAAQAVPVGLILNETLACASRDILELNQPVAISILLEERDGLACLRVHAAGLQVDPVTLVERDRFGMRLMNRMADRLGSKLEFTQAQGITVTLRFAMQQGRSGEQAPGNSVSV